MAKELEVVTVHSDENSSQKFNPITHEVVQTELPDGDIMLRIQQRPEWITVEEGT